MELTALMRTSGPSFSQSQHPPDAVSHLLLIISPVVAPHLGCLYIGRAFVVGFGQHAHNRYQNLLDALNRTPAL